MTISGNEDAKREVLDGGVERVLLRAADVKAENLKGVYIGNSNERIGSIRSSFGVDVRRGQNRGFDDDNAGKLSGPRYDPGTKQIYLPSGNIKGLSNKIGHEIGHAKIDEWGSVGHKDIGLSEAFDSGVKHPRVKGNKFGEVATRYEEVSADILMKERYGGSRAGEVVREKINFETGGVSRMVAGSFERGGQYHALGELSSYRAKAEIFGLSDIKAKIDSELKIHHGIDVNSPSDPIGVGISNLTNAYCGLQGLNKDKFKNSFKDIARMSFNLDNDNKGWIPPDN